MFFRGCRNLILNVSNVAVYPVRPTIVGRYPPPIPHLRVVVFTALVLPHCNMEKPQCREGAAPSRRKHSGRMLKFPGRRCSLLFHRLIWEGWKSPVRQRKKLNESSFIFPEYCSFKGAAFHIHTRESLEFSLQVSKTWRTII